MVLEFDIFQMETVMLDDSTEIIKTIIDYKNPMISDIALYEINPSRVMGVSLLGEEFFGVGDKLIYYDLNDDGTIDGVLRGNQGNGIFPILSGTDIFFNHEYFGRENNDVPGGNQFITLVQEDDKGYETIMSTSQQEFDGFKDKFE